MFLVGWMMFQALAERLQQTFHRLGRHGKLREADIDEALRDIRLALLEADVHYQVVKSLISRVRERALGEEVSRALNPSQQVLRIVHRELVSALGDASKLHLTGPTPRVIMLVGLQGSGKTTTAAKLARFLRERGERTWLVAADPYRPAAGAQLQLLGDPLGVAVFQDPSLTALEACLAGIAAAARGGASVAILDTAGRSQMDAEMMGELRSIRDRIRPAEVLLVADAMTGQEAVHIAQGFHGDLGLTGLILSKADGDARGGAAISMRAVTGVAIKFLGNGETADALEALDAERIASRILGMGDVMTLIEKAEAAFDQQREADAVERLKEGKFTLVDYADQLSSLRRMGPVSSLMELLPGIPSGKRNAVEYDAAEEQLKKTQAVLQSMTVLERRRPEILNGSRKRRIAGGSGTTVQEVNQVLRSYFELRKVMKQLGKRGLGGVLPRLR